MPKNSLGKTAIDNLSNWYYHEDMKKILLLMVLVMFVGVASAKAVDSYELFWPMVAGKLPGESMYQLKILKENLRGVMIFGPRQKSEYKIFIAAKRILEAEKLLSLTENDLARKSLNTCLGHLQGVDKNGISTDAQSRLKNIKDLAKYLSAKYPDATDIGAILKKISE